MWAPANQALNAAFDALLWPASWLPASGQAAWLGLPAAVLALLVFRWVSDQAGIERAKDRIKAHLLELFLYRDDFRVSLRAQGSILRHNLTYLRHALLPMAVMIVPFVLMLVQIESRFAFRALEPGERALLTLTLDGELPPSELPITLVLPDGVVREAPPLRIDSSGEVVWRVRAARSGTHELAIEVGEQRISKRVLVGADGAGVATHLYRASHPSTLLYPQEPPLAPDGPALALALSYPRALGSFAGLSSASWIFFAASIAFGFALRTRFGVTF